MKWLHSRAVWDYFGGAAPDLATPVVTPGLLDLLSNAAQGLFLAALLPLVWLAITALIFGRDLGEQALLASNRRIERVVTGYDALPSPLKKFGDDFVKGYRTRYVPVANGVRMTLQAGLGLLLAFCVGYRALDWLSVQAWIALTQWMGPHPMEFLAPGRRRARARRRRPARQRTEHRVRASSSPSPACSVERTLLATGT